jgi:hypothetical protein
MGNILPSRPPVGVFVGGLGGGGELFFDVAGDAGDDHRDDGVGNAVEILALRAHVAGVVDVIDDKVAAIGFQGDLGAEEIEFGNIGDDAHDAAEFIHIDVSAIRGSDDAVAVRGVIPPARNDRAADVVDAEPSAATVENLRDDALLDEEALVAEFGAGLHDVVRPRGADHDTETAATLRWFHDKRGRQRFNQARVKIRLVLIGRQNDRERQL